MARIKNQGARRAQLVDAASRAVLARGVSGLRLRDIAEEAGLTPGSVLYYYADVEQLLAEVFGLGTGHYCLRREEQVAQAVSARERLRACIASGVPHPGEGADTSRLLYELMPVVLRTAHGAELYGEFFARQARLYARVLADGHDAGELRPVGAVDALARSFVALEDGLGILALTGALTPEQVEQDLLQHARLVAGW